MASDQIQNLNSEDLYRIIIDDGILDKLINEMHTSYDPRKPPK